MPPDDSRLNSLTVRGYHRNRVSLVAGIRQKKEPRREAGVPDRRFVNEIESLLAELEFLQQ